MAALLSVAVLLVLAGCLATSNATRQPHVINGFKPAAADPTPAASTPAPASPTHRVDAEPSDPVDVDDAGVPGYGLNGGHGDVTPWLPSQPTWQLPQQQVPLVQVQQVQQVQQEDADSNHMMRVIHNRPGSGPTPSAHYIVNRPPAGDRIDNLVEPAKPPQPPKKPSRPAGGAGAAPGTVSETDMYLLGAIEKLVYRVDHLEKRLRRTEELVYYLMEGAGNKQDAAEPCPKDFTRAGRHCYHFSGRDLNWKSSSSACKAMDSILVEVITPEDKRDLVSWITAHQEFRGRDFWTGGLNPGLLWIWANSARPVSSSAQNGTGGNAIKNPGSEDIPGNGRCLKLAFNPATRQYNYQGGDCSARHRFICQLEEPSASRALSRIHKSLNIHLDGGSDGDLPSDPPPPPPSPAAVDGGAA
ncbi:Oxidized low-density lipoprotein receptor 1 [Frankliniella fusca]|uniref:Oxidized low-density lipoprotein receptor 1 n=1 Tax=Frankliniella fusca TaxID=407009 RepID=A0AAE1LN41_9NEOP|nr:Oxidized low-density lipoprotein receptor 1 [Frankliniella fusca]